MKIIKSTLCMATVLVSACLSNAVMSADQLQADAKDAVDYSQYHPTLSAQGGVIVAKAIRSNGAILVNHEGHRFVDETAANDRATAAIMKQSNQSVYLIFDDAVRRSSKSVDNYIELGIVASADSLEALGESLGIDGKVLDRTVFQYNRNVGKGIDFDFGPLKQRRKDISRTLKGKHFYAIEVTPGEEGMPLDIALKTSATATKGA